MAASIKFKAQFEVKGIFYMKKEKPYRKLLTLKRKGMNYGKNLLVVMMNPGSSKPNSGKYDNSYQDVVADNTQEHIGTYMIKAGYLTAFIINISDYCEAKSSCFYKRIHKLPIEHTIFHESRREELEHLFKNNPDVILAWGVSTKLNELSKKALDYFEQNKIKFKGLPHPENRNGFYHPMRRVRGKHNLSWVDEMIKKY